MTDEEKIQEQDEREWTSPSSDEAEASSAEDTAALARALEQKTKEAAEAHDKYLRTYADFENYRKRMQRDTAESRKYANEQMARELLGVVDHLELAIKHAMESGEKNEGLRRGVELIYKQLRDMLEKFGVIPFSAEGEEFDPAKHDAVMQEVTDKAPENTVVQVIQQGYRYHDKVLRHAKVSVSKKPGSTPEETECSE